MNRDQTAHERLIPLLVEIVGAESYLEFGTHANQTISKVKCKTRIGVDVEPMPCADAIMFAMKTQEFIEEHAEALGPFDVVFIDADHTAHAVRADFYGIWPHVSDDGLVLLHDTNPETWADTAPGLCGDAWKFERSLASGCVPSSSEQHDSESVTLPYHPGLTIIRKRVQWGPR